MVGRLRQQQIGFRQRHGRRKVIIAARARIVEAASGLAGDGWAKSTTSGGALSSGEMRISDETNGDLLEVFSFEQVAGAAHDVAAEIEFDGDVGVLVGFVDAGADDELDDIAFQHEGD